MGKSAKGSHRKKTCSRCFKYFKPEELADHRKACKYRRCRRCLKRIPPDQTHVCPGPSPNRSRKKECSRCSKYFEPGEVADHQEACKWRRCRHCRKKKAPGQTHDCPKKPPPQLRKHKCKQCCKQFPFDRIDEHTKECKFTKCPTCKTGIPADTLHDCPEPKLKCKQCCKRVPAERIDEHSKECKCTKCPTCKKGIPLDTLHDCPKKHHLPKKQCRNCFKSLPLDQIEHHLEGCKFRRCNDCGRSIPLDTTHNCPRTSSKCPRCKKSILKEQLNEHILECKFKVCVRCSRTVLLDGCHDCGREKCRGCGKSFLEKDFPQHQLECELKRCWQCRKSGISKKELLQHLQLECGKKYCWKCGKAGILEKEFPRHQRECNFIRCQSCQKRFPQDPVHICQFVRCSGCVTPVLKKEYPHHRPACFTVLFGKRCVLRSTGYCGWLPHVTSSPCPRPQAEGLYLCKEHAEKRFLNKKRQDNTEVEKQSFRRVLLRRDVQSLLWQLPSISELAQKWAQQPKNVAICDIEACNLGHSISHLNVFEIAIANAEGQWIIPPTIIHHEMTKKELFRANAAKLLNSLVFCKFYGDVDATEARSIGKRTATWKELGKELEAYIKKEGTIVAWFDWSSQNIDWQGVCAGLASVGFEHLLPSAPPAMHRPLLWWRKIKAALGLKGLSLTQGNLFGILYPEDSKLLSQAHYAGPDVQMLSKVLQYLFNMEGSPLPGKIENFFHVVDIELSGGKELGEEEGEEEEELDGEEDVMEAIEYEMIQMNSSEDELDDSEDVGQPPRKRARRW